MRILLVTDDYYPSTKSGAKMMRELGMEFLRRGHQITVLTPSEGLPSRIQIINDDGLTVLRVRNGSLKRTNRAMRGLRESRLSGVMWRATKAHFQANRCDLIVFYSPTIFFGALVRKLKALWHCPAYLVLRDVFPKWAVDAGILRKGMLYRYLHRKELEQYETADVIGIETPGNLDYFRAELSHKAYRLEVMLNWMDPGNAPQPSTHWRTKLGLLGKTVFFYGGNIGVAQDMDNILRLALGLKQNESIFILLVGSGSEVERLNAEISRRELRNIRILPPVPQEDYIDCLAEFDVGLVSLDRRLKTHSLTGKLMGYMRCGMPILASLNPRNDLAHFLAENEAGIAVLNGDDQSFQNAALVLANNRDLRARMGLNSRRLGKEKFSVEAAASQILAHFEGQKDYQAEKTEQKKFTTV